MLLFVVAVLAVIAGMLLSSTFVRRYRQPHPAEGACHRKRRPQEANTGEGVRPTVSVVIPALNEEQSIEWVLTHIPSRVSEVVLVDGLSTDLTEAVARRVRPDIVVVHERQRGKGAALRAGFAAARGDIVATIDADGRAPTRASLTALDVSWGWR